MFRGIPIFAVKKSCVAALQECRQMPTHPVSDLFVKELLVKITHQYISHISIDDQRTFKISTAFDLHGEHIIILVLFPNHR